MLTQISMKIKDFHTRVCAASGSNIGSLAASVGRGMRASLAEKQAGKNRDIMEETDKEKIDIEMLLEQGRIIQIRPHGGSMYPMFRPERDEAVIGKADMSRLRRGDVVLYRRENSILVLHRIWAKKQDGFYMMGDNQIEAEGPLRPEQIKGKLLAVIRNGRRISVNNPCYVIISRLWMAARPLRAVVRKVRQRSRQS